jgi:glucose-6-phosphate isomerase
MAPANAHPAWGKLQEHHNSVGKSFVLKQAFAEDPSRFQTFSTKLTLPADISTEANGTELLFDFSKNLVTEETLDLLVKLAQEARVEQKRDDMFAGKKINFTEQRAVYHAALRNVSNAEMKVDGVDVMNTAGGVNDVLAHMREFSEQVRSGAWKGYTGKKLTTIVNVGIGGSDL